jgi:dTDP-4-amino-4,6-dideoxygalactose transaminase
LPQREYLRVPAHQNWYRDPHFVNHAVSCRKVKVPLLDLKQQNSALTDELRAAFDRVLASGMFILGPEVDALEHECAAILGVRHAIGVSSGTDAILLALMALDIHSGDEVVCPSFTFFATGGCIARTGATPVFCDSSGPDFNASAADLESRITPRTRALMPVHLFGQPADMNGIMQVAKRRNLPVIEDAAQALGASFEGRQAGTLGTFGAYSFFPSKNLGGFGEGGLLVTNDDDLGEKARILRGHGAKARYFHTHVGGNFRIDALRAALLRVKLPHLAEYTARRKANARYYIDHLADIPELALPASLPGREHIWNQFTLRILDGRRDHLRDFLRQHEIGSEIYYPLPLHLQECFARYGVSPDVLPQAEALAREVLSIPIFPELTRAQQDLTIDSIRTFFRGQ